MEMDLVTMEFVTIWEGLDTHIQAIKINNNCPAGDFLSILTEREESRVYGLFDLLFNQQNGQMINNQKVKKLKFNCKNCFEFKPSGQIRLSFVYLKQKEGICLLDGFKKKKDKWPKNKIEKTTKLCKTVREYESDNMLK